MKRNKSALYLLPTFYRQVSDAIIIMIVMGCLIISMDTIICVKSNGAFQFLWTLSAGIAYLSASYCLYKYIPTVLKKVAKTIIQYSPLLDMCCTCMRCHPYVYIYMWNSNGAYLVNMVQIVYSFLTHILIGYFPVPLY